MGNSVYFIWRSGVYMQGVFGIYDDLQVAIDKAEGLIEAENDDYHTFHVSECGINEKVTQADKYSDKPLSKVILERRGKKVTVTKRY